MTITNARLEAILQRQPGLRPKVNHLKLWYLGEFFIKGFPESTRHFRWGLSYREGQASKRDLYEPEAHALIFRAMCEALPDCDGCFRGPEAFENLCKYWEHH